MQSFMNYYVTENNLKSINAFKMRKTMANYVQDVVYPGITESDQVNDALAKVDYATWIYSINGDPSGTLNFTNYQTNEANNLADAYIACNGNGTSPAGYEAYNTWPANQKVVFMQQLMWGFADAKVQQDIDNDL